MEHARARLEAAHSVHETLDMLWALQEQERVVILTMWWQWWQNRNKVREGELPLSAEEIVRRTKSYSLEYADFFGKDVKAKTGTRWRPPLDDIIKLNVDGAFNAGDARAEGVLLLVTAMEIFFMQVQEVPTLSLMLLGQS